MQVDFHAMNTNICNCVARTDNVLAKLEGRGDANRFNRGIDAAFAGHRQHGCSCIAIGTIDRLRCSEFARDVKTVLVDIDLL